MSDKVSFNITADQVRAASREYLAKGLLSAQHPRGACVYKDGELRCAVGAAFNDEQLAVIHEHDLNTGADSNTLFDLLEAEGHEVPSPQEQVDIAGIQSCHDMWIALGCDATFDEDPEAAYEEAVAEDQFREIISV